MDMLKKVESPKKKLSHDDDKEQIRNLLESVPIINDLFHLHYKVGEGAFSTVFLATLKASKDSRNFAVKYLVPTCHPKRIQQELKCLKEIGGVDHIVGLELCLRHAGSVVFIMPFIRHDKFGDYIHDMSVNETKNYMRALLTALRRVHTFNIIHRDVKPSNFLYDRKNRRYLLVDFGLAQPYVCNTRKEEKFQLQQHTQSEKRKRSDENNQNGLVNKLSKSQEEKCYCFGNPTVCSLCLTRPPQTAPRAGTPGFRAPEVLLKHPFQTPAIDIWACGVMMLCILSNTQPFFRSPDDCTALAEITSIFGTNKMQQCSRKLGKKITCSENIPGVDITSLCLKLQQRNKRYRKSNSNSGIDEDSVEVKYPREAFSLLTRLLELDYQKRITAEQALNHPFLKS